jgi:hypothetical protein
MKLLWLGCVFVAVSGCAVPAPEAPEGPSALPTFHLRGFGGDTVVAEDAAHRQALGAGGPADPNFAGDVLYINFTGAVVTFGADNALQNVSSILPFSQQTIPAFNSTINAPLVTSTDAMNAVFDRIRTYFLPYAVTVVRTRPSTGSYTMVIVGGDHTLVGRNAGVAGVAPLDCDNANKSNLVYDFSNDQSPDYGGVVAVALTAAHEAGHSYGLEHTDNTNDIMYSVGTSMQTLEQLFTQSFTTTGNYSEFNGGVGGNTRQCGNPDPINNQALLTSAIGTRTPSDAVKPTLTWSFPPPLAQTVPLKIPLSFTATDNVKVARLEVYKNLELIAVLKSAPYTTTLTAQEKEQFYLTVEAIDDTANRTVITRAFIAESKYPTLCQNQAACPTGRTCTDGFCKLPIGPACKSALDCMSNVCKPIQGTTQSVCTAACSDTKPCPAGSVCMSTQCVSGSGGGDGGVSMPGAKTAGEACTDGAECASGRCQDTCVAACDDQTACEEPNRCEEVSGGLGCKAPDGQTSGCSLGGSAPPPLPAIFLFGWVVLGRFRRRFR